MKRARNFLWKVSLSVLGASLVSALILSAPVAASQREPDGSVGAIHSKLEVERGGQRTRLRVGDTIQPGDLLRTNRKGKARVGFRDGLTINLGKKTRVRIVEHNIETGQTILEVEKGMVRVERFNLPEGGKVAIRTPAASFEMADGHVFLKVSGGSTEIAVFAGGVQASSAGNTVQVAPGRKLKLHSSGKPEDDKPFHQWYRDLVFVYTNVPPMKVK